MATPKKIQEKFLIYWDLTRTADVLDPSKSRQRPAVKLRDELVMLNQPLAVKIAKRFRAQWDLSIPFDDLMQAAMIGVFRAVDIYSPHRPTTFSTLAGMWILHELQQCAQREGYRVKSKVPAQVFADARKFRTINGRNPTPEELGISEQTWKHMHEPLPHFDSLEKLSGSHDECDTVDQDANWSGGDFDPEQLAMLEELAALVPEPLRETWDAVFMHGMNLKKAAKDLQKKLKLVEEEVAQIRALLA